MPIGLFASKKSPASKEILARSRQLKKKKTIGRIVLWLVFLLVLFLGLLYVLRSPFFLIKKVAVSGNSIVETELLLKTVQAELAGQAGRFIPRNNIFFFPRARLEQALLAKFPRFQLANASLIDGNILNVEVKERSTDTVWCPDAGLTASSSEALSVQCYFSDENGFVFAESPTFLGSVFIELRGGLSEDPLGQYPVASSTYRILAGFARLLPKVFAQAAYQDFALSHLELNDSAFTAVVRDASRKKDWHIVFDREEPAPVLAEKLFSVLQSPAFKKDMVDHKNALEKIDLRYGNKVFYEFE